MTGAVVIIAEAIRWPIAFVMVWGSRATLTAAKPIGAFLPRVGLALLDVGDSFGRLARQMLMAQR